MKYHFNLTKDSIITQIISLRNSMQKSKLKIHLSNGIIENIYDDRIYMSTGSAGINMSISNLKNEDLIIILRYLQNMEKCKEIVSRNVKYGEIYNVREKSVLKIPCNKEEVNKKILEYLSTKKNIASIRCNTIYI